MGVFSFTEKLVSEIMSSLGLSVMRPQCAPICVSAIIEGVFLLRNSIPKGSANEFALPA